MAKFRPLKDHELQQLDDEALLRYVRGARDAGASDHATRGIAHFVAGRREDLVRRARLKLPTEEDAEEIADQVVEDAVKASVEGGHAGEIAALLTRILQRRIADFHRAPDHRRDAEGRREISFEPLPGDDEGDEPRKTPAGLQTADETGETDVSDVVERVLATLNPAHKRVVELYTFEDHSADETARLVNEELLDRLDPPMSPDNVHQIARRFRKRLLEALGEPDT